MVTKTNPGPHGTGASGSPIALRFADPDNATARPQLADKTGVFSDEVEALVAERGDDRSLQFWNAVRVAIAGGMGPGDLEELMRQHPEGCASKFLTPDRLRKEIDRAWSKAHAGSGVAIVDPTYPDLAQPVADARAVAEGAIECFLREARDGNPVHAIRVSTGVGKTRIAARRIAADLKGRRQEGRAEPILYAVPRHRLGEDVAALFREHGVTARVFRGRNAEDPDRPGKQMCDDLPTVKIAIELGAPVSTSCCRGRSPADKVVSCRFYETCSYQRQTRDAPDVWIVAHQLLFQPQAAIGEVALVIIDESFWATGLWD